MNNRLALVDSGNCVIQQQRVMHIATERETLHFDDLLSPKVVIIPASAETKILSQHATGNDTFTVVTGQYSCSAYKIQNNNRGYRKK